MCRFPLTRISDLMTAVAALGWLANPDAVEKQLLALRIPKGVLNEPETLIPMREVGFFYENAARSLGVKDLGTYAGRNFKIGNYGYMGRYVVQGPTLRDAFRRMTSALNFHTSADLYGLSEPINPDRQAVIRYQMRATITEKRILMTEDQGFTP